MVRTVDVSGLSDEAVAAVEKLVALLRQRDRTDLSPLVPFTSCREWQQAIQSWAESHSLDTSAADWDRDRIYAGCGE